MINSKFWQAFFAIAPLASFFLIIAAYIFFIATMIGSNGTFGGDFDPDSGAGIATFLGVIFTVIFLIIGISLGSLVFYIVHAVKNPNMQQNNLLLVWILLFIFANGIGQLIYWIVEILGKRETSSAR